MAKATIYKIQKSRRQAQTGAGLGPGIGAGPAQNSRALAPAISYSTPHLKLWGQSAEPRRAAAPDSGRRGKAWLEASEKSILHQGLCYHVSHAPGCRRAEGRFRGQTRGGIPLSADFRRVRT